MPLVTYTQDMSGKRYAESEVRSMGRRQTVALAGTQPRSALTYSQQGHLRAKLMSTASAIAHQLDE